MQGPELDLEHASGVYNQKSLCDLEIAQVGKAEWGAEVFA
jgi:hypothetical protein